jgi:hypothetical protein
MDRNHYENTPRLRAALRRRNSRGAGVSPEDYGLRFHPAMLEKVRMPRIRLA